MHTITKTYETYPQTRQFVYGVFITHGWVNVADETINQPIHSLLQEVQARFPAYHQAAANKAVDEKREEFWRKLSTPKPYDLSDLNVDGEDVI